MGEAVRAAVYKVAQRRGFWPLPDAFHGGAGGDHRHAFYLPEDLDKDGQIDHVLLFAESGLPKPLIAALAEGGDVFLRGTGRWQLLPDWMGAASTPAAFTDRRATFTDRRVNG